jgi:excisionase family DNA binding protein
MQLLKVNQVAELLNLKPKTVREYIRQGRLSAVNLNPAGLRPVQTSRVEEIVLDIKRGMGL